MTRMRINIWEEICTWNGDPNLQKKHQMQKLLVLVFRRHIFQFVCWSDSQISQFLAYQKCHTQLCISKFNCNSVASWNVLAFLWASKLSVPEMCAALMCKPILVHQIQISFAILLHSWDFRPRFFFMYMTVVFSDIISMWFKFLSLQ